MHLEISEELRAGYPHPFAGLILLAELSKQQSKPLIRHLR